MQQFEDWLLEGQSINIVGLAGSGRTLTLLELEAALKADPAFWSPLRWSASDVLAKTEVEIGEELRSLQASRGIPVLLIDDFGEVLITAHGKRLEQRLFALVNDADPNAEGLRCVLVTTPRDRNIEVAGSGLRERCKTAHPVRWRVAAEAVGRFGCADDEQLLAFCGGTHLLVPPRENDPESDRGIAMQRGRALAVTWTGQLRNEHHRRVGDIVSRPPTSPSNWRTGDIDEALVPMVIGNGDGKCLVVEALRRADLKDLLASEHWPSKQPTASVRRFLARCGNEPNPRWIDNFLSDTHYLDVARLARFLVGVLDGLEDRPLEVLSRSQVGEVRVDADDLAAALRAGGIRPEHEQRIDWRVYDKRDGNLHDRQLLLPGRTEAFKLPPATVLVGQALAGNEADAELPVRSHDAVKAAWSNAVKIW